MVSSNQSRGVPGVAHVADYFIGRQPIINKSEDTYAYELLFRSSEKNCAEILDGEAATSHILNCSLNVMGLDSLVGNSLAFINVTEQFLLESSYDILPRDRVVIELLESVEQTPEVVRACKKLKARGYKLALDDFVGRGDYEELLSLADIVKVDFRDMSSGRRNSVTSALSKYPAKLLAEKVETWDDVKEAIALGYSYFQGYYYQQPVVIQSKSLTPNKQACLHMLQVVNSQEATIHEIEIAVKRDLVMTTRLMSYINSAYFGLRSKVTSIAHGIKLLGMLQMRKWASLVAVEQLSEGHSRELICDCLARGLFCEKLETHLSTAPNRLDLFMVGLMSLIDTMTSQPKEQVIEQLNLKPEVVSALLGEEGELADALRLAEACEKFDNAGVSRYADKLGLDRQMVVELHHTATHDAFSLAA